MPSTIIDKWVIGAPEVDCVLDRALWLQYTWRSRYCRARWFLYCWTWASRPGPRGSRRMIRRCFTQSEHLAWWDSALMRRRSWKSFIQTSWVGCAKTCCHPSVNTWNCLESSHPVMCLKMRHWQKKIISMMVHIRVLCTTKSKIVHDFSWWQESQFRSIQVCVIKLELPLSWSFVWAWMM